MKEKKNYKVEKHCLKLKKEPWEHLHRLEILVQKLQVCSSSGSSYVVFSLFWGFFKDG